jgi:hypothetical protein
MRSALTIVIILVTTTAAEPVGADPRFGVDAYGAWNHYGMKAINDSLSSFNQDFGTALEPIREGGSWGLGLRLWPHPDVRMRLGFENLQARSEDPRVRFDFGVRAFTLGATWFAPSTGWARYGAGVELGPHYAQGGLDAPGASLRSSGNGFGGHVAGEVMVPVRNGWSVNGTIGYRWAAIDGVKLDKGANGLRAQYDGLLLRIGMALDSTP